MTKQDERQRLKRRLQEYSIELATEKRWQEAIDINLHLLSIVEDPATYNRLGKAYMEMGRYQEAQDAYQQTLRLTPTNAIARKNLTRIEALLSRDLPESITDRRTREIIDPRLFITEAGKTAITTLIDVPRSTATEALAPGEQVEMIHDPESHRVLIQDADGRYLGMIEPKLGQRLNELVSGGNRYIAALVQFDTRMMRLIIREVYQDPKMRMRVSFPGKLSESPMEGYIPGLRYDDDVEELLDEEELPEELESTNEDYSGGGDDEELGLEAIEKDIPDDDESEE